MQDSLKMLAVTIVLALVGTSSTLEAQVARAVRPLSAPARSAVAAAVYNAFATDDTTILKLDAQLRVAKRRIDTLSTELSAVRARGAGAQAQIDSLTTEISKLQDDFASRLSEHDRQLAQAIAVYRNTLEDAASTPEGMAALQRFNTGDMSGGLADFDRIADARDRVIQAGADIERAAARRAPAYLALTGIQRGGLRVRDVIPRFEQVVQLDPGRYWDWLELSRLYLIADRADDARRAAERAVAASDEPRARVVTLTQLGDVLHTFRDLSSAKARYEESLEIARQVATTNLTDDARRDVAVSAYQVGRVLIDLKEYQAAYALFKETLDISRDLALRDSSDQARRDVSAALTGIGEALGSLGNLPAARASIEESLSIDAEAVKINPTLTSLKDLSMTLSELGRVLEASNDLVGARGRFRESVAQAERVVGTDPSNAEADRLLTEILEQLARVDLALGKAAPQDTETRLEAAAVLRQLGSRQEATGNHRDALGYYEAALTSDRGLAALNPTSATVQRNLMASLIRLGDFLEKQGDISAALACYRENLSIARVFAASNPANVDAQRIMWVSMSKLARLADGGLSWKDVLDVIEGAQARGLLGPDDQRLLNEARRGAIGLKP